MFHGHSQKRRQSGHAGPCLLAILVFSQLSLLLPSLVAQLIKCATHPGPGLPLSINNQDNSPQANLI